MNILHVSKSFEFGGGVIKSIEDLVSAQLEIGLSSYLSIYDPLELTVANNFESEAFARLKLASNTLWNRKALEHYTELFIRLRPDLIHLHSLYHVISPSVIIAAEKLEIPMVMTLHDHKLLAPCYSLYTEKMGACTKCVGKTVKYPAIKNRCIKSSYAASSLCTVEDLLHRSIYGRIDAFHVPSEYLRDIHVDAFPDWKNKIEAIPWGGKVTTPTAHRTLGPIRKFVFFGRLVPQKGVLQMLTAWVDSNEPGQLTIIGDGPLREVLLHRLNGLDSVRYLGSLSSKQLTEVMPMYDFHVLLAQGPETFSLSVAESASFGIPSIITRMGNLAAMADKIGAIVPENNSAEGLAKAFLNASQMDLEQYRLISRMAQSWATRHTWNQTAIDMKSMYERVLINRRTSDLR